MTEKMCLSKELVNLPLAEISGTPSCEEEGGAEVAGSIDATSEAVTTCADRPTDFCTTLPSSGAAEGPSFQSLLESLTEAKFVRNGRPPKLNAEVKEKVCMLLCVGLSRRQAATMVDIDHATITHASQTDPDFGRALVRAEEFCQLRPNLAIAAAGLRDWRAAAWLLTHQKQPTDTNRLTAEERAEKYQVHQELARRNAELNKLQDILDEERAAAREQREQARKEQKRAEKQAQYEAENPHLFRRKKKKDQSAGGPEKADVSHG